jgi:hypothetical protein
MFQSNIFISLTSFLELRALSSLHSHVNLCGHSYTSLALTCVDFMSDKYYSCRNSLYFIRDFDLRQVHRLSLALTVIGVRRMKIMGKVRTFTGVLTWYTDINFRLDSNTSDRPIYRHTEQHEAIWINTGVRTDNAVIRSSSEITLQFNSWQLLSVPTLVLCCVIAVMLCVHIMFHTSCRCEVLL